MRTIQGLAIGIFCFISVELHALPLDHLNIPDDATLCYVQAGADPGGAGTQMSPYNSLADVEANVDCTVILVKKSKVNDLALDGGIFLKPGQKLFGLGQDVTLPGDGPKKRALITNTSQEDLVDAFDGPLSGNRGVGVILSQDNEVAGVHIDGTYNAGISAINVANSEEGIPGAIIHHVLITNAVTSGDTAIDDLGIFADSAAIEISSSTPFAFEVASPVGGPGGDAHIAISDSVIRDGIAGISSIAEFPGNMTLSLDNVTVERMNPAYSLDARVFVLRAVSAAAGHVITINDSRFYDIDNQIPAIFPQTIFDDGFMDFTLNNSVLSNPSNLSSFGTLPDGSPGPRGDGFTALLFGGTANFELTDFTIENVGQDAIEVESDFVAFPPSQPLPPPFEVTRSSVATMNIKRAIIKNSGRADLFPLLRVLVPVPEVGPASTADKQYWVVSESTFEGGGALSDIWAGLGVVTSSVLIEYRDLSVTNVGLPSGRPLGNSDNLVIDLGVGELGSTGGNRFVNTISENLFVLDGMEDLTVDAQRNWWDTELGLDPILVDNVDSPTTNVDASSPLGKDPRPSEGKGKGKGKRKGKN